MDYLDGLNPSQKEAVLSTTGPSMVIAGAGFIRLFMQR